MPASFFLNSKPIEMKATKTFLPFVCILLIGQIHAQTPLWKTLPVPPAMPPADTTGYVNLSGKARMYFAVFNQKENDPVLLVHGGFSSSDDWGFEVPLLKKKHQVIVVDCRGRGRSMMGDEPLSYELMTSDILNLMDTLKLEKVSIIGWSDGGIIGLLMAVHHPERIDKLVAFGANYSRSGYSEQPPDPEMGVQYISMVKEMYQNLSPTPKEFSKMMTSMEKMYAVETEIPPSELREIKIPVMIADGEYEQFITREHTEKLAQLIPNAKLVIMKNVSHGGPTQDPSTFHREVSDFLNGKN